MAKIPKEIEERVSDSASVEMLRKADEDCIDTCFNRMDTQDNHCKFGTQGVCCRICYMGPCKITPRNPRGVCGANVDTIVARNLLREIVAGTAAHSDHGRHLVMRLKKVAQGKGGDYEIKDEDALLRFAAKYEIETDGRDVYDIANELADIFIGEFSNQEETLKTLKLAPEKLQQKWKKLKVEPEGIDRMCVESMHRTNMGVDHDYKNLIMQGFRTSLADGWGGARIASMVSDILFGTPTPVRSQANLGVLEADQVNVLVHGHEPALSEMLAIAVSDPEIKAYAKAAGAEGVNLAGLCCTANEVLMRHGVPVAGNFLQQELAIITGSIEMMVTDVQCVMPSLPEVAANYHTEIVSTTDIAQTIGATHMPFESDNALESAKTLLKRAIDNFKNRVQDRVQIPDAKKPLVAGFSVEAIKYMLGGKYRKSFRPLNDAIISGRIKGCVGIVGCNNPKCKTDYYINTLTTELLSRDVLVLQTGCAAQASAKAGSLTPEMVKHAGPGLTEVCDTVGMPPVLHMGSCVDNARILEAAAEIVWEGGLGDDLFRVPAVGVAPEWMSEKAVAIGHYFVASGVDVVLGHGFHISGSENVKKFLTEECREIFGGCFHEIEDPMEAADKICEMLDEAREGLGINKKAERNLLDMKERRQLEADNV
ncbi:carbon-monoxide dehydrogenase catalytic subunit [bacterium M21]|nr:carbon-monoxide dehydrogenase catalytic subunit [bacterium M21]